MSAPEVFSFSVGRLAWAVLKNKLTLESRLQWENTVTTLSAFFGDEATANLQMAAPDLLASLENLLHLREGRDEGYRAAFVAAQAAIAKARGGK